METPSMFLLGLVDILAALFVMLFMSFGTFQVLVYPLMALILLKGLWTAWKSW